MELTLASRMGVRWRPLIGAIVATLLVTLVAVGSVGAQEDSLVPSFGDGRLVVLGAGFRAGEVVSVTVRAEGVTSQFVAAADAQGRFRLETNLVVRPCSAVEVTARGDRGTSKAAITTAPGACAPPGLPDTGAGGGITPPAQPPALAAAGVVALALTGAALRLAVGRRQQG